MPERLANRVVRVLVERLAPYKGRVYDPCCGSAGMFALQGGIHAVAPRGEFLEVTVPWNRTSAVASQSLSKSSPMIAMTTPERQLEDQLIEKLRVCEADVVQSFELFAKVLLERSTVANAPQSTAFGTPMKWSPTATARP